MSDNKILTTQQQNEIREIALTAVQDNNGLNFETCYTITLIYYLAQFSSYDIDNAPPRISAAAKLLYKKPTSSYLHYRNDILYSTNEYAKAIKAAEIKLMGDDPRCPW